jgi:hypothetical protein
MLYHLDFEIKDCHHIAQTKNHMPLPNGFQRDYNIASMVCSRAPVPPKYSKNIHKQIPQGMEAGSMDDKCMVLKNSLHKPCKKNHLNA